MLTGTLSIIPRERVLAPLAVTTIIFEDRLITSPSLSNNDLVIMLVAAPLSTIAVCAFFPIRSVHLAAVVGSPSLSTKLASFASFSLEHLTARTNPDQYFGIACAACPTESPHGKFCRYVDTLNSVSCSIGAGNNRRLGDFSVFSVIIGSGAICSGSTSSSSMLGLKR